MITCQEGFLAFFVASAAISFDLAERRWHYDHNPHSKWFGLYA